MRFLANENFPRLAVESLRERGHDVLWARTAAPGGTDESVIIRAQAEQRILLTFDKDFGELAFRRGMPAACGIVLFRVGLPSPAAGARKIASVIDSRTDWAGHFSVIEDERVNPPPTGSEVIAFPAKPGPPAIIPGVRTN